MGNDNSRLNMAEKADLAYALSQLLEAGKVTPTEVDALLNARSARIKMLETELQRLRSAVVPPPRPYTAVIPPVLPIPKDKEVVTQVLKHFDAKVAGRFYALVQHRVPSPTVRAEWLALARKIGAPAALKRFEKLGIVATASTCSGKAYKKVHTKKFDAKTAGRFYALVQHRVPSAAKRSEWRALARKIGAEAALERFEAESPQQILWPKPNRTFRLL